MTLTIIEYGGKPRQIECESFEFRTNRIANLITIKKPDGTKTIIKDISVIKSESKVEK